MNNDLKRRIIDISYKHKLSHIGSCLSAVDIIDEIYAKKKKGDKFVLSAGHAGLALYVVLERYLGLNAEELLKRCGIHPDRVLAGTLDDEGNFTSPIDCSTGSLGHGVGIAVGMALGNPQNQVYVVTSDGECAEGSVWEALRIAINECVQNIHITVNHNGYTAYDKTDTRTQDLLKYVGNRIDLKVRYTTNGLDILDGLDGHYHVLMEEEYSKIINL